MNSAQYCVVVCEHDSSPWRDDHLFTRAGAWNRVRALSRLVVLGWPHPIWCKVWRMHSKRTPDGKVRKCRVLVYDGDLRTIR